MSNIGHKISSFFKRRRDAFRRIFRSKGKAKRGKAHLAMNQVLSVKQMKTMPSRKQIRHLPKLLSTGEKRLVVVALVTVIVTGSLLGIRLLNTQRTELPAVGGEYTEGLIGSPQLINPLYALTSDVDMDLARLVYTGLMRYDSHDGLVPDLAESYTISEDQKVYTFVMREDAKWHDGRQVRPADVIFTVNAIQTMEYRSPLEVSFTGVNVTQIDERTVQFTLEEPFSPFLSLLSVGILPSHLWGEISPLNAPLTELNTKPIGSGPYKFEKLVKDSKGVVRSYTFTRNNDFYRGAPYLETLNFKFYPDTISAVEALRNNNVEGLSFIPTAELETVQKDGDVQVLFPSLQQYTAAFLNLNREDKLGDVGVRQALSHATDKSSLVTNVLDGRGKTVESFILEGMVGEHPELTVYEFDQSKARELLNEAGWEIQENATIRQKGDTPLILEVVTINSPELVSVAEELKQQWLAVGVDVQVKSVDQTTFQTDILKNRAYDILISGELYGIDPDPYAFWHSSQAEHPGLNLSGFSNRKADEFIEIGRSTADRDARGEAYQSLQDLVTENVPAIFLYQPSYTYAVGKKVKDVDIPQIVIPADRFSRIESWYIKTKKALKKKAPELETPAEEEIVEDTVEPEGPEVEEEVAEEGTEEEITEGEETTDEEAESLDAEEE